MKASKYKLILNSAKDLFWKYGLNKVSVKEICKASNISKMTFYRNFKNKNALALKIFKDLTNNQFNLYKNIIASKVSFSKKISDLINLKYQTSNNISKELLEDIYSEKNTDLKSFLLNSQKQTQKEFYKDFKLAQKKGEIRKDIKIEFLIYLLQDINKKLVDPKLVKLYNNEQEIIMEFTKHYFYGILPEK